MTKVAAIQMVSGANVGANLINAQMLMGKAKEQGAKLVVLPENFAFIGQKEEDTLLMSESKGNGRMQNFLSKQAKELDLWIIGGTIPIKSDDPKKVYSACILWNNMGEQVAQYNKLHLFDVYLAGSGEHYNESATYTPGNDLIVVKTPFGNIGLSICYDLRFPEMYIALRNKGADILCVPSAFTHATGQAHWKALLTARAIENQCYIIAPNQGGTHENKRKTYGHSCIIGPWGLQLSAMKTGTGFVIAETDLVRLEVLREEFPVFDHRQLNFSVNIVR